MKLDRGQIHTWTDDHGVDTALDRMSLMTIEMKETESFKDYA